MPSPALSFRTVQLLKGIALLMMVFHHCFSYRIWYVEEPVFFQYGSLVKLSQASNLCVALFAFLTGWTYYHHRDKSFRYSGKKIATLLTHYWVVLLFVALIAAVCCSWRPSVWQLISEIFPIVGHPLMIFVWYVWFYVLLMLLLPLVRIGESLKASWMQWAFLISLIPLSVVFSGIPYCGVLNWAPHAFVGYLCARCGLFESLLPYFSKRRWIFVLAAPCAIAPALLAWRYAWLYQPLVPGCILSAVFFIFGIAALLPAIRAARLESTFCYLGTHSLNIWFIHGLFFSTISRAWMQQVFFRSSHPCYIFCIVTGCSLLLSMLILPLQKRLSKMLF